MRDKDQIILESIYSKILLKEDMDSFEFVKILSGSKGQTLYNPLKGDAGNYTNDEGVEVSFRDEAPIVEFDGEEYAGDIELNYIGVENVEDRNKGAASRELDRIVSEADKHDISIGLTIDPEDVVRGGGKMGLSVEELKSWYQKRGFIFQGRNGYRPKKSEDRSKIEPKKMIADPKDIPEIEDQINTDLGTDNPWENYPYAWSDTQPLFAAYIFRDTPKKGYVSNILKGYQVVADEDIYYYDGINRPVPVINLIADLDDKTNKYIVKLKNT